MADLTREVLIKIIAAYDAGGMDAVSGELKKLNKDAEESGQSMGEAAQEAQGMSSVLQGLGSAASGSSEGIFKIASGIRALSGNLPPVVGQVGLLIAVFAASYAAATKLFSAFKETGEEASKMAGKVRAAKDANAELNESKLADIKAEYQALYDKITAAAEAQNALNTARRAMADAKTANQLADIDLREKQELAKVGVNDEVGRARTRAAYQRERSEVSDRAAIDSAKADAAAARQAEAQAKERSDLAKKEAEANAAAVTSLQSRYDELQKKLSEAKATPLTKTVKGSIDLETGRQAPDVQVVDQAATAKRIADIQVEIDRVFKEVQSRQLQDKDLRDKAAAEKSKADAAGIGVKTADIKVRTAEKAPFASRAGQQGEEARIAELERKKKEDDAKLAKETAEKEVYASMLAKAEEELAAAAADAEDRKAAVASKEGDVKASGKTLADLRKKYPKERPDSFAGRKITEAEGIDESMRRQLEELRAEAAASSANLERVQKAAEKVRGAGTGDAATQAAAAKVWEALRAMAATDLDIAEDRGTLKYSESKLPEIKKKVGTGNRNSLAYRPVIEQEQSIERQSENIARAEKTKSALEESFAKTMSDFLDVASGLTRKMASVSSDIQQLKAQANFGRE